MLPQKQNIPFLLGPEDAQKACLLIHGFSGTAAEMRGLGDALAVRGIRVSGVAVAGHSGDHEVLARSTRKGWISSVEAGLAELASYQQVFVAGLSMGGTLSLLLAAHHPQRITGVIAMSTPTRVSWSWQVNLARPFLKWFYPFKTLDFRDPQVQKRYLASQTWLDPGVSIDFSDPQVLAAIKGARLSISALAELSQLVAMGRANIPRVRCPLLLIHSKRDKTVLPFCAEEIKRLAINARPKTLHWLEQSDHVITVGPEREQVFRLVGEFIEAPTCHLKDREL